MTQPDYETVNHLYNDFACEMLPFGSLDVRACIKTAETIEMSMSELAELIQDYCQEYEVNIYGGNSTLDINAILNDYIMQKAINEVQDVLNINIDDVYFYQNYMDCPLHYSEAIKQEIIDALITEGYEMENFSLETQYVFDEMGISNSDLVNN